ncbi:MAG: hypothetical protein DRI37_03120 [Chloroflexi bacterium]|nr:MAG: hypothetical protein DRI37_03120 [Chloroflexota bacterium]
MTDGRGHGEDGENYALKVTLLFPNALSPRPRGRVDEKTCPGDAPETGAGSSVGAAFALMQNYTLHVKKLNFFKVKFKISVLSVSLW